MQLYEYATIRFVPQVEREEFFNIGVIVFCKQSKYIRAQFFIDKAKYNLFKTEVEWSDLETYIRAFEHIVDGESQGGPIAKMEVSERFRWLTAVRSSCIQTSRPHPGRTADLDALVSALFQSAVL
ncbi:DUF3037 domain-containing protein [Flavobacterium sp. JP2137]|uniref:DUF3037 domain-containing protein n=1 Tax=Flavobacterium sp. JP2137 TaxID=3414510 RepID=UPI003D2FC7F7